MKYKAEKLEYPFGKGLSIEFNGILSNDRYEQIKCKDDLTLRILEIAPDKNSFARNIKYRGILVKPNFKGEIIGALFAMLFEIIVGGWLLFSPLI